MKNKQSKNIIIAVLCCLIVLMGVGFAILSTQLVINGNANITGEWDIYIESITPIEEGYTGVSDSAFVDQNDKTKANFTANLKKPRDFVEYKLVVKNGGNIDAQLKQVLLEETNSHQDIKFSHTAVEDQVLYAGTTTEFTLKAEFLESATTIEKISVSSSIKLSYEQYDPSDDDYNGEGGMGAPAPASTKVMAKLNDDGTVNLSISEYGFDEAVDGIELYTSDEYDGEFTLIADITDGSSINVEESNFNEYYEIKSYNIQNGTKVYTDYTGNVELIAQTPEIEKMFIGCSGEMVCGYAIYNVNDYHYDGVALYYSDNGLAFDVATNPGEGTDVYSTATYYPPSGETYYYKIYGYLDLNGHLVYSELSDEVSITNEN